MNDLIWGLALIALVACGVFVAGLVWARWAGALAVNLAAVATVTGLAAFTIWGWRGPWMARSLPFSNLVVLGNWAPAFAAFLAALALSDKSLPSMRRRGLAAGLGIAALVSGIWPLCGATPRCGDAVDFQGHVQQTTPFTCSAASAATFLRAHGIDATEQEMAELCLTRQGTTWMGMYRGLALKTRGTRWKPEFVVNRADALRALSDGPVLANFGLGWSEQSDAERLENGWVPGVEHTVVLLRRGPGLTVTVVDPTPGIGRETWTGETVGRLWRNVAFRLVEQNVPARPHDELAKNDR